MLKKFKHKLVKPLAAGVDGFMVGLLYMTRGLTYVLPVPFIYSAVTWFGYVLYLVLPGARQRLFSIVSECMPELTDGEVRHVARSVFGELLRPIVDFPVFARHGERILEKIEVEGLENVAEADAEGKGVIIMTPHAGGWDVATAILTYRGYALSPVCVNPKSTLTPRAVKAVEALGVSLGTDPEVRIILTGEEAVRRATEVLKKGRRIGITPDVSGKRVVEYFGRQAALADGTAQFAYHTGAKIVPAYIIRDKRGVPCRGIIREQVRYELTGDRETDVTAIMRETMKTVERDIRMMPDQYTQWGAIRMWWQKAREPRELGAAGPRARRRIEETASEHKAHGEIRPAPR